MPPNLPDRRRRSRSRLSVGAVLVAALASASACGTGSEPITPLAADTPAADAPTFGSGQQQGQDAGALAAPAPSASLAVAPSEDGTQDGAATPLGSTTSVAPAPSSTAAPAPTPVFPDLAVQRIADQGSSTVSAELAGGTLPVMLWFWSPF